MTTIRRYVSGTHPGTFEVNELYSIITAGNRLFEVRWRDPGLSGSGLPPPSEVLMMHPDCQKLIEVFLEWDSTAEESRD